MIWKFWPIYILQQEIGESALRDVEEILPLLDTDGGSLFFDSTKTSLVKLIAATAPEDYFKKKSNLGKCLNFLSPDAFDVLQDALGLKKNKQTPKATNLVVNDISASNHNYQIFCRLFDIPARFQIEISIKPPSRVTISGPTKAHPVEIYKPYKVLKHYQADIFYRTTREMEAPMSRLIMQMPTGSGKTRTAMEVIAEHFKSAVTPNSKKQRQVIWLSNSKELCEQSIECFTEVWEHVGTHDVEVHRVWGGHKILKHSNFDGELQFIVASFQTIWPLLEKAEQNFLEIFEKTTLLVVDEAHIAVANTYAKTIRKIAGMSHCKILGLTATPGRTNEDEVGALSDLFRKKIVELRDPSGIWDNSIKYLRSIDVLSKVEYEPLIVNSNVDFTKKEVEDLVSQFEYSESILKKIGASKARSAEILSRLIVDLNAGSSVILFAPSLSNSKFIASMLIFLGYNAAHVDGTTSPASRDYFISKFLQKDVQILCNYGVLTTGFDAPKTDVVCIARPTKSPVLYSQMIGRGLRGPAVGGTKSCKIIEIRDNFLNQGTQDDLYEYFDDYWIN